MSRCVTVSLSRRTLLNEVSYLFCSNCIVQMVFNKVFILHQKTNYLICLRMERSKVDVWEEGKGHRQEKSQGKIYLTSWSRALLQKPTVTQLVKKFPAFNCTRRSVTVFITVRHWTLIWARLRQPTPSHPIPLRYILILSSHFLSTRSVSFPSVTHLYIILR
jgi:hypothetical protein